MLSIYKGFEIINFGIKRYSFFKVEAIKLSQWSLILKCSASVIPDE